MSRNRASKLHNALLLCVSVFASVSVSQRALASTGCDALATTAPYYGTGDTAGDLDNGGGTPNTSSDIPVWSSFKAGNIIKISTDAFPADLTWTNIGAVTFSGGEASYTVTSADVARGATRFFVSWTGGNGFSYIDFSCESGTETGSSSTNNVRKIQIAGTKVSSQTAASSFASGIQRNIASRLPLCPADPVRALGLDADAARIRDRQCLWDDQTASRQSSSPGKIPKGGPAVGVASDDRRWSVWGDVKQTGFDRDDQARLRQFTGMGGIDYLFSQNLLLGFVSGYEHSDFNATALEGNLKGNGATAGIYAGYRFTSSIRGDLAFGRTWLDYGITDRSSVTPVTANFGATREMISGGLTGSYLFLGLIAEPSARGLWIYQRESSYTDSSGTSQDNRNFSAGRASFGSKFSIPDQLVNGVFVSPYVGLYGDYWFGHDTAMTDEVSGLVIRNGWSARSTAGLTFSLDPSKTRSMSLGVEVGGLGSNATTWGLRGGGSLKF